MPSSLARWPSFVSTFRGVRVWLAPLACWLLVACGGGTMASAQETTMPEFTLTSSAFEPGGIIPARFTCDGDDVSPDLSWAGAPDGVTSFALIVDDPDADGFLHWALLDFSGTDSGALPAGFASSIDAPQQATNGFGRIGWGGPCPPSGAHTYRFRLHALGAPLALAGAPDAQEVRAALGDADVLGTAELIGTYARTPAATRS